MAEQLLHGSEVRAVVEQVGCERVPQRVGGEVLVNAGGGGVFAY